MIRFKSLSLSFLFILLVTANLVLAQNQSKASIFEKYDRLIKQLQESQAMVYSPNSYVKAMKYYKEASEDFDDREDLEKLKTNFCVFRPML